MNSVRLGRPLLGRDIAGGLPQGPRSRSVGRHETREKKDDRGRERADDYSSYRGAPPTERARNTRTQPSVVDMSPPRGGRGGRASYSDVPDVPPLPRSRRSDVASESSASSRSTSTSSASSTFMGRVRGSGGYASSRTSLDDDPEPRKETGRGWMRQRTPEVPEPEQGAFSRHRWQRPDH